MIAIKWVENSLEIFDITILNSRKATCMLKKTIDTTQHTHTTDFYYNWLIPSEQQNWVLFSQF